MRTRRIPLEQARRAAWGAGCLGWMLAMPSALAAAPEPTTTTPASPAPEPPSPAATPAEPPPSEPSPAEPPTAGPPTAEAPPAAAPPAAAPPAAAPPPAASPAAAPAPAASEPTASTPAAAAPKPPRIDGMYLGAVLYGGIAFYRVNGFPTPGAFASFGGNVRIGQMVNRWFGLGIQLGGTGSVRSDDAVRQSGGQGGLLVDLNFVPAPKKLPLQLRGSFGFGAGALREEGRAGRSGFGGALFGAAIRYELFPGANRYRPNRGGGFGLGPELGWIGATPAARGRPMANVIYLGLATTFYFGS